MSNDIKNTDKQDFSPIVRAIGSDLEQTQVRVIASANADMLFHYGKVGHFILYLQKKEGWGSKVIDNLSKAIRSQYPNKKGYSRRNIFYMCQFASAYPLEILIEMGKVEELLNNLSVDNVLQLTKELNQLVQEPLALIEFVENQRGIITQQPVAQYALSGYDQPIGVSDYQLSKAIPDNLKSALPTVEEVEEELSRIMNI